MHVGVAPVAAAFVRRAARLVVVVTRSAVQLMRSPSAPDAVPSAAPIAADAVTGSALFSMDPAAFPACACRRGTYWGILCPRQYVLPLVYPCYTSVSKAFESNVI